MLKHVHDVLLRLLLWLRTGFVSDVRGPSFYTMSTGRWKAVKCQYFCSWLSSTF